MAHFHTPWKQKTMIPGGIEVEHWLKMGQYYSLMTKRDDMRIKSDEIQWNENFPSWRLTMKWKLGILIPTFLTYFYVLTTSPFKLFQLVLSV